MIDSMTFIVIVASHDKPDEWKTFEYYQDAKEYYEEVIVMPNTYSASVVVPLKSTDYTTLPKEIADRVILLSN